MRCQSCSYYKLWLRTVNKNRKDLNEATEPASKQFDYSFRGACNDLGLNNEQMVQLYTKFKTPSICPPKKFVKIFEKYGMHFKDHNLQDKKGLLEEMIEVTQFAKKKVEAKKVEETPHVAPHRSRRTLFPQDGNQPSSQWWKTPPPNAKAKTPPVAPMYRSRAAHAASERALNRLILEQTYLKKLLRPYAQLVHSRGLATGNMDALLSEDMLTSTAQAYRAVSRVSLTFYE